MGIRGKNASILLVAGILLVSGTCVRAQMSVGDEVSLNLNGSVSGGYSASYGDDFPSGHGFTFGGNADLSGSYYDPRFLSFHINPYANQSRTNSNFQSITSASGLNAGASIFSGSHFPGWVNFSQTFNGTGNYAVPGLPNYVTHGDGRSFGFGWSEVIPNKPVVTATYQQGSSAYSVFGSNGATSDVHYRNFAATVFDNFHGFHLNGNFHHSTSHSLFPEILPLEVPQESDSANTSFGLGVSHKLPWRGTVSTHFNQSDYSYQTNSARDSGNIRTLDSFATVNPTNKLNLEANAYYTDNLLGNFYQTIANAGGGILITPGHSTSSFSVAGDAVYAFNDHLRMIGRADHRQQMFAGGSFGANSYSGVVTYFRFLWGGRFNATQTVSENKQNFNHQSSLGLNSSVGYGRSVGKWNASANANYFQNQQTLLVSNTTSGFSYAATLGRKVGGRAYASLGASGSRSFYNVQNAGGYSSRGYTASLSSQHLGASASYSKSSGTGILTAGGVVPNPLPSPIPLTPILLYDGESYSYSLGGSPVRKLSFTATYSHTHGRSFGTTGASRDISELANFYMQYSLRKLYFNAGYSRILQGFSETNISSAASNSYYIGLSRWFKFF